MDFVKEFLDESRESGKLTETTLDMYQRDMKDFKDFIGEKDWLDVVNEDILQYIETLKTKYSDRSIYRKVSSLKSFYKYLLQRRIIDFLPMGDIELPKLQKFIPRTLEQQELNRVLEQCGESFEERRDSIIIRLLYETGLKIGDILELERETLKTYEYKSITASSGKRIISEPISEKLGVELKEHMEIVEAVFPEEKRIFVGLSRQGFRARFIAYGKRAGIEQEISPNMIKKISAEVREKEERKDLSLWEQIRESYMKIGIGDD